MLASVLQPLAVIAEAQTGTHDSDIRPYEPLRSSGTIPGTLDPAQSPESRQKALSGRDDGRPRAEVTPRAFE